MIIVWRGWGITVPLITIIIGFICFAASGAVGGANPMIANRIAIAATGFLSAAAIFFLARHLETTGDERILVDQATGQQVIIRRDAGSFFFIPTRFWPWIVSGLGVVAAVTGFLDASPKV